MGFKYNAQYTLLCWVCFNWDSNTESVKWLNRNGEGIMLVTLHAIFFRQFIKVTNKLSLSLAISLMPQVHPCNF